MYRFETDPSDLTINVTTRYSDYSIEQEVSSSREVIARNLCQLQEEGVRKALSKLGYLSPEEAEALCDSLHSSRLAYQLLTQSYVKASKERTRAESKLKSLKQEWEKNDHYEVSLGQKLEALINILYSDRE